MAGGTNAAIVARPVEYQHQGVSLEGFLAYDDSQQGKRPGVVIVHEWWGLNPSTKKKAEELAAMGYVAFAVDMFGKGVLTDDPSEAGKLVGALYGKPVHRERIRAGFDVLAADPRVDRDRIAAIGFCFGGTTCLELAYSGAPVKAVVSFHGSLSTPKSGEGAGIRAKILVLHGADDPMVPPDQVNAFENAMRQAGVDWQLIAYGNAVHAFTQPEADQRGIPGVKYNADAARRSWRHMTAFFDEVLSGPSAKTGQ